MNSIISYLIFSAILFSIGLYGILTRKNSLYILISAELILSAVNINFATFARFGKTHLIDGRIFLIFTLIIALLQFIFGLMIIGNLYFKLKSVDIQKLLYLRKE